MAQIPPINYIASTSLEEYFVDENTGLPLANGAVYFYRDIARTQPKLVYQLTGDPNNVGGYSFTPLPNPVQLSATGTFMDNNGNNITVYYYPYDTDGNLDLYYVVVTDQFATMEFSRSAWPPIATEIGAGAPAPVYENQLSNSQFVDILFSTNAAASQTYTFATPSTYTVNIAPDWALVVVTSAASSVTVARNAVAGGPPLPTNPPYTLTITPGANINARGLYLRQRLQNNPGIWSQTGIGGTNGYVSASVLLASGSQAEVAYVPSSGASTSILIANNTTPTSAVFNNTVQLPDSTSGDAPYAGYVDINVYLPNATPTTLSSIQVVGLSSEQTSVPYVQEPVNRQMDHLYHYYQPKIFYKPIPSYLVGWDFPLNPANVTGIAAGSLSAPANGSQYVWDQTIVWTSINGTNIGYSRDVTGALKLTVNGPNPAQIAIVQYLEDYKVAQIMGQNVSVNVSMNTQAPGVVGTVSLFSTAGTVLPNVAIGTYQSIVATLNTDGSVATFNQPTGGNWIPRPRSLVSNINAKFTLAQATSGNFLNYGFSGWGMDTTGSGPTTANFFAIVVGFSSIPAGQSLIINSISLVPGDIPTIPAPQTQDEVARECARYFWRTYQPTAQVGTGQSPGAFMIPTAGGVLPGAINGFAPGGMLIDFPSLMRRIPTLTFYSHQTGVAGQIAVYEDEVTNNTTSTFKQDVAITLWSTSTGIGYLTSSGAYMEAIGPMPITSTYVFAGVIKQSMMVFHLVADARLGIV